MEATAIDYRVVIPKRLGAQASRLDKSAPKSWAFHSEYFFVKPVIELDDEGFIATSLLGAGGRTPRQQRIGYLGEARSAFFRGDEGGLDAHELFITANVGHAAGHGEVREHGLVVGRVAGESTAARSRQSS